MNSELKLEMTDDEAKSLWRFMSNSEHDLNLTLSGVRKNLESLLWDRLSIEEMALVGTSSGTLDG